MAGTGRSVARGAAVHGGQVAGRGGSTLEAFPLVFVTRKLLKSPFTRAPHGVHAVNTVRVGFSRGAAMSSAECCGLQLLEGFSRPEIELACPRMQDCMQWNLTALRCVQGTLVGLWD